MDKYSIPQSLDEPTRIFLLSMDEVVVFLCPFLISFFVLNIPISGTMISIVLLIGIKRLKSDQGHHFLQHLGYWHLPQIMKLKMTPPSHMREFVG